jgi:hypothetical protein
MRRFEPRVRTAVSKPRLVTDHQTPGPSPLGRATTTRLRNQLTRAFQHGFGAEQGLRILVTLATKQMLCAGAERATIDATLEDIVRRHPASLKSHSQIIDGQTRVDALTAMVLRWSTRTVGDDQESMD